MRKFLEWIKQEESGQGMVEYGIIVALVVIVAVAVFGSSTTGLGGAINNLYKNLTNKIVMPS